MFDDIIVPEDALQARHTGSLLWARPGFEFRHFTCYCVAQIEQIIRFPDIGRLDMRTERSKLRRVCS